MSDTTPGDQRKSWKYHDVDKGFAWIVLIGCFVMYLFVSGSFKAYGVLYTEMVETYSSGYGNTAWINTIAITLLFCLGPIANLLCKIYSFQRVTFIGGILLALGYFLSGFVTRMEYMYLTFLSVGPIANRLCKIYSFRRVTFIGGILLALGYFLSGFVTRMEYMYLTFLSVGLGYGFTFAPCFTIISYYFEKRRALANGILVSGSGIGTIALSFLYKFLIDQYYLRGTFWITGAIFANVCVAACILRQPRFLVEERKKKVRAERNTSNVNTIGDECSPSTISDETSVRNTNKRHCGALNLKFSLYKNVSFTVYVTSFMCCTFAYIGSLILVPVNVKTFGYDKTYVALSVTIFGGVEAVARIVIGWFADLDIIPRKYIYTISMFIGGVFSLVAPLFENFTFIAIYAAVAAIFPGSYFSLMSVLIIDILGLENFLPAFGLLTLSMGVGTIPSQPVIGWLYDLYGNWHLSFILVGCVYILAGALILIEPFAVRCCTRKNNNETSSHDNQQHGQDHDESTDGACNDDIESTDTGVTY